MPIRDCLPYHQVFSFPPSKKTQIKPEDSPEARSSSDFDAQDLAGKAGKSVHFGDGLHSSNSLAQADRQRSFSQPLIDIFKRLGHSVQGIFSPEARERRADNAFAVAHSDMLTALAQPYRGESLLHNDEIMNKLIAHSQAINSPLSIPEITQMVRAGEHIMHALDAIDIEDLKKGTELEIQHNGKPISITSNRYTTRAICWYMAAKAAEQECENKRRDAGSYNSLPYKNAFFLKDTDGKLHAFLKKAPTCSERYSSHMAQRSATTEKHKYFGIFPSNLRVQHGIEDWGRGLPCKGGAVLFDKMKDGTLYVKIEDAGWPKFFSATEPHEKSVRLGRFFHALGRNLTHSLNFLDTRIASGNATTRTEHVHTGVLRQTVYVPYLKLLKSVQNTAKGLASPASLMKKEVKKFGLSHIKDDVALLKERIKLNCQDTQRDIDAQLVELKKNLGQSQMDPFKYIQVVRNTVNLEDLLQGRQDSDNPLQDASQKLDSIAKEIGKLDSKNANKRLIQRDIQALQNLVRARYRLESLEQQASELQQTIANESAKLGGEELGIERHGTEVHLNIFPDNNEQEVEEISDDVIFGYESEQEIEEIDDAIIFNTSAPKQPDSDDDNDDLLTRSEKILVPDMHARTLRMHADAEQLALHLQTIKDLEAIGIEIDPAFRQKTDVLLRSAYEDMKWLDNQYRLETTIFHPFMDVIKKVREANEEIVGTDKDVHKRIEQGGTAYVKKELTRLYAWADRHQGHSPGKEVLQLITELRQTLENEA